MVFLEAMDQGALHAFHHAHFPWLTPLVLKLTHLGDRPVILVLGLLACAGLAAVRWWWPSLLLLATVALSFGLVSVAKRVVDRPRPNARWSPPPVPQSRSFPSGHALQSTALFGTLALLLRRRMTRRSVRVGLVVAGFALPFLIGVTGLYLGYHYVTDVLAGWAGGASLVLACGWLDTILAPPVPVPVAASCLQPADPESEASKP
jgi:undecaprenyl-diphosphatase